MIIVSSLLCVVGKIYAGILVGRVCRVSKGFIDDGQGGVVCKSNLHPKEDM